MAKKDKKSKESKKARAAEKKEKASKKSEQKNKKMVKKLGDDEFEDDVDIDELLSSLAKEQEAFEAVSIENVKRPSKRLNATLIANNNNGRKELLLFGGETTNGVLSHFYNELFVYSIDNDLWKKITSKNSPLPRSSHAMCNHPSGVILMFGGEFSSPKQSTFYHYGDTWILDSQTKEWMKVEYKKGPLARSGHRMVCWKNYIIMHGGFRDLGTTTTYLSDTWLFDITSYKWHEVGFPPNHTIPDARSGHSLIPTQEGAILWGGYTKVKAGKGLQKGKVLTDCWNLKMKSDTNAIRWERRRKQGFQPSPRVGTSMCFHKGRGILFGGVYDYDESEENLESVYYNSLFTFNIETNRWYSQSLRSSKKRVNAAPKKEKTRDQELEELLNSILAKANLEDEESADADLIEEQQVNDEEDVEEKKEYEIRSQLPHERFNAATTVIDDILYIYGGVWESGEQEFNLDSFYGIDLAKLDGCKVFWEDLSELDQLKEESDDDEDDEDDDDDDDEDEDEDEDRKLVAEDEEEEEEIEEAEPEIPDLRPWLPHPKAFESLRAFYVRTGAEFLEWAISQNRDVRGGKLLKSLAFDICEDRWWERRDQVRIAEDSMEELGNVSDVVERDASKPQSKRR